MLDQKDSLSQPLATIIRKDFVSVRPEWDITRCLESLRGQKETGGIFYIYVTEDDGKLVGVIPIRRLLAVEPDTVAGEIMITGLITLLDSSTVYDACELFIFYKFLAIPVVDTARRLLGIVDVNLFTDEMLDLGERRDVDEVFQWIGVKMAVLSNASPMTAFRYRFPWLGATMTSGILCAALAGFFEETLANAAILAMFLTVALGLGESVSIQSMTLTMQAIHGQKDLKAFVSSRLKQELFTALMLALACGTMIGIASIFWPGAVILSASIGLSIAAAIVLAGLTGLAVPAVLHKLERDPKVAAGPITLAVADLTTVFLYLSFATMALKLSNSIG